MRAHLIFVLLGLSLAGTADPALGAPTSPLDFLTTLDGPAEVQTRGNWLFVIFGGKDSVHDRIFRVETADLSAPVSFQTSSSKVLYWDGHLILLDQKQDRAWHFWILGADERSKGMPGARPEAEGLKALLADYEVTRVVAYEILSLLAERPHRPSRRAGERSAAVPAGESGSRGYRRRHLRHQVQHDLRRWLQVRDLLRLQPLRDLHLSGVLLLLLSPF